MTYNTLNPVPSTDPRDLDDNAQAFDRFLLSTDASELDRMGVARKTWSQMERDAAALLSPNIAALSALVGAADKAFYFTGPATYGTYQLSAFTRSIAVSADQATFRSAIGALAATDTAAYAGSAAKLTTARTLAATGDASWSATFDGSGNVSSALTLANTGVTAGSYTLVTVNAKGLVTGGAATLPVANGGTGGTTQVTARATLGITPGAWTAATLQNSWVLISGGRASYRSFLDMVQLDIALSGGTATDGTVLFTLPTGFRPANAMVIPVAAAPSQAPAIGTSGPRVILNTDGTVTLANCAASPGIRFLTQFSTI